MAGVGVVLTGGYEYTGIYTNINPNRGLTGCCTCGAIAYDFDDPNSIDDSLRRRVHRWPFGEQ